MSPEKAKFYCVRIKVFNVVLGIIVMGLAIHSHFQSAWIRIHKDVSEAFTVREQFACALTFLATCPFRIEFETIFVYSVITAFVMSFVILAATCSMNVSVGLLRIIDILYHFVAPLIILLGAALYILSTEKIEYLYQNQIPAAFVWPDRKDLLREEKLAAASLSIVQSLVYWITVFFICKS